MCIWAQSRRYSLIPALALAVLLPAAVPAHAQAPTPVAPAQFDPSDVYYQAWRTVTDAENLEKDGQPAAALDKYRQAANLLASISRFYPQWKPEMLALRVSKTNEAIAKVTPAAQAQRDKQRGVIAELEGGQRKPAAPGGRPAVAATDPPNPFKANPVEQKRLEEQQRTIERIRKELQEAADAPAQVARQQDRIKDLEQQLAAARASAETLRARLARAPMESDLKALNQQISDLQLDRDAMRMALERKSREHLESQSRVAQLDADLKASRQRLADLERDLGTERKVSNEVVDGLRRQLKAVEATVKEKDNQLATANQRIAGLQQQLKQSQGAYEQLQKEFGAVSAQRDQMSALLNLSDAGRIETLIEQVTKLEKQRRELQEKYDVLHRDSNDTKDLLVATLTDLNVARAMINRLKLEKVQMEKQFAENLKRLAKDDRAVATEGATVSTAEVETLRRIIKRQRMVQSHRQQAVASLIVAARQVAAKDPKTAAAIKVLESEEIKLTPEEEKLVAGRADADLFSPYALDPERAAANQSAQARNLAVYDRLATKAFTTERYAVAAEFFSQVLEENPGHVASLCKLGVVHLKMADTPAAEGDFRRATELEPANPYAHRMLGWCLYQQQRLDAAEKAVARGVKLSQDDAKSQNLLGNIRYELGRAKEAEQCFRAAITADPMFNEPYYNLAVILAGDKERHKEARGLYQKALELGAVPDPELEKVLSAS